jgi:hypothetical protein
MSLRITPRRVAAVVALAALTLGGLHAAGASSQKPARLLTPSSPVTTSASELYTGVTPCRLVDTRLAGGPLSGTSRNFDVSGNLTGQGGSSSCGIPAHATSIAVNITGIVATTGSGFIRGWAAGGSTPNATLLNFGEEINVSNMVNIPLCRGGACTDAFTLRNWGNNVHVVADVLGYYSTPMFASISTLAVVGDSSGLVSAAHPTTGVYNLTFDRPIDSCVATVTDTDVVTAHVFAVSQIVGQDTGLRIFSKNTSNTLTNAPFHVQLSC